ncbi:biotin/lipoyl-containing protein [Nocardiopsis composta]|uniref:Pyruvate/2-oxoglutarate dehydrogenase complex dihydrolipoamide acyltransferase (E2) component n=1 Tax=Nocardiopsis composta TaxID=157465 RepID=A0A7W8QIC1_9ACTN|nr:biotin/lipoyl-containing protein [Nocardiopsis composta]MBB5431017.1 pyruvate/2-oxoglutarate dehydrogenase complex dihydrolipoamide acyltransferase (E2) component [Nocardiopsis composta]
MEVEVRLPQWGMGMQEGEVLEWLKKEGERVLEGESIVDVEAAKVNESVAAPASGTLVRIAADRGATVPVRGLLAVIETDG